VLKHIILAVYITFTIHHDISKHINTKFYFVTKNIAIDDYHNILGQFFVCMHVICHVNCKCVLKYPYAVRHVILCYVLCSLIGLFLLRVNTKLRDFLGIRFQIMDT
jgi:hypothetical protein